MALKGKGAKAPGFVFSALALLLSAMLLAALSPTQPPPPPVAEYAPEAVQAIKDAPPEQSADNGLTDGSGQGNDEAALPDEEDAATTMPSTPPTSKLPPNSERTNRCVGDPPRQTEDPQSPPCVPYFEGDNGGATSKGVDANAIRVAFPSTVEATVFEYLLKHFNTRYEFYGRQIVNGSPGTCFGGSPSSAQNLARAVDRANNFASSNYCDVQGAEHYYYNELARRKIVSVNSRPFTATEASLAEFHPYQWTFMPTFDKGTRHQAELACALRDGNAEHAGPEFIATPRKWGVLLNSFKDMPPPDYTSFTAALEGCGIDPVVKEVSITRDGVANAETASQVQNAVYEFRSEGVTSIILIVHANTALQLYSLLDGQGYQPELMVGGYHYIDEDFGNVGQPKSQTSHMFGVLLRNPNTRQVEDEYFYRAVQENAPPGYRWPYAPTTYFGARWDYTALLVLASGIQLAGPHLTPESFAAGLLRAKWPNPPDKNRPAKVTLGPGTHSFIEDASVMWWAEGNASEDYGTASGFCYAAGGRRFRLGQYGKGDPGLFTGPCNRPRD